MTHISNITEMNSTALTLMDLTEEIRFLKRDIKAMCEELLGYFRRMDTFFDTMEHEKWKKRRIQRNRKRLKKASVT